MSIAKHIDHTNLKPTAIVRDIDKLCNEAIEHNFRAVCVHPIWIGRAKVHLENTDIKIATVVGFPLGANDIVCKVHEARIAISRGANEIDMVWNLGAFKNAEYNWAQKEIEAVAAIAKDIKLKVIVEVCYLDLSELIKAHRIVRDGGADCIKTSTGFGPSGATFLSIATWKGLGGLEIKAAGGIRSYYTADEYIRIGADILGTSHGVAIVQDEKNRDKLKDQFRLHHYPSKEK